MEHQNHPKILESMNKMCSKTLPECSIITPQKYLPPSETPAQSILSVIVMLTAEYSDVWPHLFEDIIRTSAFIISTEASPFTEIL